MKARSGQLGRLTAPVVPLLSVLFLLEVAAFTQNTKADPSRTACGPSNVSLHAHSSKSEKEKPIPSGQAQLYVVEAFHKPAFEFFLDPTVQVGLDGRWIGATRNRSYIAMPLEPGEHHLCVEWKSHLQHRLPSLASLHVEPGKKYYFRARMMYPGGLELQHLDPDEGQLLISRARPSSSNLSTK